MSLYGYKKKHKPALWTTTPQALETERQIAWLKQAKRDAVKVLKRDRALKARRRRELDKLARGLRKVQPSRTPKRRASAVDAAAYRKRVKEWLVGKQCVGCLRSALACEDDQYKVRPATQCHHKHGRRGALLLHEPLWLPVCAGCHDWIHRNVAAARELGLYAPAGQWNRMPP